MPRCAVCPKDISLTKDGVLRAHLQDIWLGGPNYRTEPCPGGGRAPRDPIILPLPAGHLKTTADGRIAPGEHTVFLVPVNGTAPRGAFEAQRRAYAKMGMTWSPKAIREQAAKWRR